MHAAGAYLKTLPAPLLPGNQTTIFL